MVRFKTELSISILTGLCSHNIRNTIKDIVDENNQNVQK